MSENRRGLRRILGWGGALVFSLFVWAALFRLIGGALSDEACHRGDQAAAECSVARTWPGGRR